MNPTVPFRISHKKATVGYQIISKWHHFALLMPQSHYAKAPLQLYCYLLYCKCYATTFNQYHLKWGWWCDSDSNVTWLHCTAMYILWMVCKPKCATICKSFWAVLRRLVNDSKCSQCLRNWTCKWVCYLCRPLHNLLWVLCNVAPISVHVCTRDPRMYEYTRYWSLEGSMSLASPHSYYYTIFNHEYR